MTTQKATQAAVVFRRLRRNRAALLGLVVLTALAIMAVIAPWIVPYDPFEPQPALRLLPPGLAHPMGTDDLGRDLFSRVIFGSRISLAVGLAAVAIGVTIGLPLGLISGYFGSRLDEVVMRGMDILLAFPAIILALLIIATLGISLTNTMLAIGIVTIPVFGRIVRGSVLSVRENEYVEAARALGYNHLRVMFRHILPNAAAPIIVQATLNMGTAILAEAGLSFLGLGVRPPEFSWGQLVQLGRAYTETAPWYPIFPGLIILIAVLSINMFGDGLRDALDPRLKE